MKLGVATLALATMLAWMPSQARAATGSVRITITRPQFVVGGGNGTLHFQGERYLLIVGGVSAGPFGAARVDLWGRAYNMRTAANIHGIYSSVPEKVGLEHSGCETGKVLFWNCAGGRALSHRLT